MKFFSDEKQIFGNRIPTPKGLPYNSYFKYFKTTKPTLNIGQPVTNDANSYRLEDIIGVCIGNDTFMVDYGYRKVKHRTYVVSG